jgi:glycerol-3-phosphate dehydrogenase (NAD+)
MATVAARNGHEVVVWCRDSAQAATMTAEHRNPKYLKDWTLLDNISATSDLAAACEGTSLIIHALPCQQTPDWLRENKHIIPDDVCICSTAKGLYVPTKQLLSRAMLDALQRPQPLAFLSGPSFAAEMMKGDPTAVVVASQKMYHATAIQRLLSSNSMRVYTSQDVVGVQLGGALKNPLAVGAGMIEGMGLGINTMSAFVARSCVELTSLCIAMGGKPETISGLSGVGDLMLTAFGNLSRNRTCGMRLVKGEKLEDILKTTTVEGVPTAAVAVYYSEMCGLECPLFTTVEAIINGRLDPSKAQEMLMSRKLGKEHR